MQPDPDHRVSSRPSGTASAAEKVFVVSGGSGGIGRVTARELARWGGTVIIIGRDPDRGREAEQEIRAFGSTASAFFAADLASQTDVRRVAAEIMARHPRIDVLVNNAGGMRRSHKRSADGIEMTFALNHLGYYLFTRELLPALRAAPAARIVNVASRAHEGTQLDFDDLQNERRYNGLRAYKRSKLANLHFTYELARRLAGTAVTVNALHPGFVATDIGARSDWMATIAWRLATLFAINVEEGAQTSLHLATAPEVEGITGKYFCRCAPVESSPASHDRDAQERLWRMSAEMTGISPDWPS